MCAHPQAAAIHDALTRREPPVVHVARQYGVSRDALNRCARAHLALASRPRPPGGLPRGRPPGGDARRIETSARARERFLHAYALYGNITTAAKAAGIGRATVYVWQEHIAGFAEAMTAAGHEATEVLEQEAWRRARDGTPEPVYQHGREVGTVQRYSDALLMFLLKARAPERFGAKLDVTMSPTIKTVAGFLPSDVL